MFYLVPCACLITVWWFFLQFLFHHVECKNINFLEKLRLLQGYLKIISTFLIILHLCVCIGRILSIISVINFLIFFVIKRGHYSFQKAQNILQLSTNDTTYSLFAFQILNIFRFFNPRDLKKLLKFQKLSAI